MPGETATKHNLIPVGRNGTTLTLAMTDPTNVFAMDDIKFITGLHVEPVVASETAIRDAVAKYFGKVSVTSAGQKAASGDIVSRALEDFGTNSDRASSSRSWRRRRRSTRPRSSGRAAKRRSSGSSTR